MKLGYSWNLTSENGWMAANSSIDHIEVYAEEWRGEVPQLQRSERDIKLFFPKHKLRI